VTRVPAVILTPAGVPDRIEVCVRRYVQALRSAAALRSIPPVTLAPPAHFSRARCAEPDKKPRKSAPFAGNVGAAE